MTQERWHLTDEIREKFIPILQDFINKVESNEDEDEPLEIDFSGTELNPHRLELLLKEMDYVYGETDTNGWQWDFWTSMTKPGYRSLLISGTGATFTLKLECEE